MHRDEDEVTHLIPILDPKKHEYSEDCWCKPYEHVPGVWVHIHSNADMRIPDILH